MVVNTCCELLKVIAIAVGLYFMVNCDPSTILSTVN